MLFVLAACAGPGVLRPALDSTPTGLRFAIVHRDSGDSLRLTLRVDAGSRDANPPQVAAVAAWQASNVAPDVTPRCLPDATRFETYCSRPELGRCIRKLAAVLQTRSGTHVAALRNQLQVRRRHVQASALYDTRRLALRALLDDGAARLEPLGVARRDSEVKEATVSQFLADHYGPTRSVLVIEGDVTTNDVEADVERAFSRVPAAGRTRDATDLARQTRVLREPGPRRSFAIAASTPSLTSARAVAKVLTNETSASELETYVVPLRETVLTIVAGTETSSWSEVARLARRVWTYRLSGGPEQADRSEVAVGIGLVGDWYGGGESAFRFDPPVQQLTWQNTRRGQEGTAEQGGRLIRREGTDHVVALRIRPGSASESPDRHGLTTVAAHTAGIACDATPFVTAEDWGLLVHPRQGDSAQAAARLLDCIQASTLNTARFERARALVLDEIRTTKFADAWSAELLFPDSPGTVAPSGSLETVARLHFQDVAARFPPTAGDVEIFWGGPRETDELRLLEALSIRLDELPEGTTTNRANVAQPLDPPPIRSFRNGPNDRHTRAVVGLRGPVSDSPPSAQIAARVYAERLAGSPYPPGVVPEHTTHGASSRGEPFVALTFRVRERALDRFPDAVAEARTATSVGSTEDPELNSALARARAEANLGTARDWSMPNDEPLNASDDETIRSIYESLRQATPRFGVGRPSD